MLFVILSFRALLPPSSSSLALPSGGIFKCVLNNFSTTFWKFLWHVAALRRKFCCLAKSNLDFISRLHLMGSMSGITCVPHLFPSCHAFLFSRCVSQFNLSQLRVCCNWKDLHTLLKVNRPKGETTSMTVAYPVRIPLYIFTLTFSAIFHSLPPRKLTQVHTTLFTMFSGQRVLQQFTICC